jgi:hypothetical protein
MLPSAISLGGDTGEFRFNSIRSSNDKFVGLRAPQTLVNSYRMRFPEGPGSQDNCLKRGTGAAMSDNIYDYALYFGACAGEGQDWISAVQDGSSNNHNSTVYSPNQGDRVGWRVIRSRGTVLAPENVLVNDYVSSEEYSALIGGSVFPVFGVKVIRTTNTPTSIGTMAFQTNDAAGVPYNKLIINDNVYIDNGHLGSSTIRVPKIWVHDFDCDGTGCPSGGGYWFRDSTAGYVRPMTATDDVRTRAKFVFEEPQFGVVTMDILAQVGNPATNTISMAFRDMAGAEMLRMERQFLGTTSNTATMDMHFIPKAKNTYTLGSASPADRYWSASYVTNMYAATIRPAADALSRVRSFGNWDPSASDTWSLGETDFRWKTLFVKDLDCTGNCGHWYRDTSAGWVRPGVVTDDVRTRAKFVFEEPQFGVVTMDIRAEVGNPATSTIAMAFRDMGGGQMLRLERQFLGTTSNKATFEMSILPSAANTYFIGGDTATGWWSQSYVTNMYTASVRPKSAVGNNISAYANWNPSATDTWSLGNADSLRWLKLWVKDIDAYGTATVGNLNVTNIVCTGSCPGQSYWMRDPTLGYVRPLTRTDDVRTGAKFVFEDALGGVMQDIMAQTGNPATQTISMAFRDNAGTEYLRMERRFLGTASNIATISLNFVPSAANTYNLGSASPDRYWSQSHVTNMYAATIRPKTGTTIDSYGALLPSADNNASLTIGSATQRWYQVYAMGVQTNGLSGISGSGQVLAYGHFIPAATATYTLGTAALRWNYVYTSNLDTTNFSVSSLSVTTLTVGGAASISSTLSVGSTLTTRNITPSTSGTYSIGDSGTKYANLYLSGTAFVTGLSNSGSNISVQSPLVPSSGGTYDLGGSTARWRGGYFQDMNVSASMTVNGSVAKSGTYTINGGCFFTFSLGVMTNTNC